MAGVTVPVPPSLRESLENSKCEYRRLGKSGLTVSVPIFGCMSFGDPRTLDWYPPPLFFLLVTAE